jgi:hypothetical protein
MKAGHLCGYVRFPKRLLKEEGYDGIVRYVPVHGGVTFAREAEDGSMVYGFDCTHSGDCVPMEFEKYPQYRDPGGHVWTAEEVREEIKRMADALISAPQVERRYLRCKTNKGRAKVLDAWLEPLGGANTDDNFGLMIQLLGGEL